MSNQKRRKYDRQFKLEAVRLSHEPSWTVSGVARDLGISENVLHVWRTKLKGDGEAAFPGKGHLSPDQDELRRLRRQLADDQREW
ncbi:MAG: transposase, partial [candidate division Zixibacteria bacterium]|nr:transposase [candidate division Zixibacteria bacterium]